MLRIADKVFDSHLFTGTGKFASPQLMVDAIRESGSQLVTLALKRVDLRHHSDAILAPLLEAGVTLLPNTSGAKTAEEAIFAAQLAREALGTRWLKLEIHPDARWLLPDPIETLKAAEKLVQQGFTVLPYCGADPVLCKRLEDFRQEFRTDAYTCIAHNYMAVHAGCKLRRAFNDQFDTAAFRRKFHRIR